MGLIYNLVPTLKYVNKTVKVIKQEQSRVTQNRLNYNCTCKILKYIYIIYDLVMCI